MAGPPLAWPPLCPVDKSTRSTTAGAPGRDDMYTENNCQFTGLELTISSEAYVTGVFSYTAVKLYVFSMCHLVYIYLYKLDKEWQILRVSNLSPYLSYKWAMPELYILGEIII